MRLTSGAILTILLAGSATLVAEDRDSPIDGKKLIGKWEPREPKKDAKATLEFTKDGKLILATEFDGKTETYTGTYKVNGNKLAIAVKLKEMDLKHEIVILKLTDDALETDDAKGKKESFRRVK